jgi:glycosyltransferase involved in cell wall biosynthesis
MRAWYPPALAAVVRHTASAAIVHAHDSHAAALAAVARAVNSRLLVVCHRRVAFSLRGSAADRWKYRHVDRWIAVSGEIAAKLQRFGAADPTVVHSAIDVEGLRTGRETDDLNRVRRELEIPPDARTVSLLAALVPQKGHEVLVGAAATILSAAPDTVFLIAGEGHLGGELRRRVRRAGMGASFRFTGFREDATALVGLATVVVVPSVNGEGSSAVIKEAMALGTPVVVSDLPGNLEVLGGAGVSFASGDAGALAGAVATLLGDPQRRSELGSLGSRRSERWHPHVMTDGVLGAYRSLVQPRACATEFI